MKKFDAPLAYLSALIFLQTLFFKFSGASESVWIFKTIGIEPWGRYLSGSVELVAAVLLLIRSTRIYGAVLGFVTMAGALLSHLVFLGIDVNDDGGLLFFLCLISLASCGLVAFYRRTEIPLRSFGLGVLLFFPVIGFSKVSYNDESAFGIHGYDPVSYLTVQKALQGKKNISHSFDGVTYLFESQANKDLFAKQPAKYVPAYGGWCAYAMAEGDKVDVDPKTFKIIDGKTYLFYNGLWGNTLPKWLANEKVLKTNADKAWLELVK